MLSLGDLAECAVSPPSTMSSMQAIGNSYTPYVTLWLPLTAQMLKK